MEKATEHPLKRAEVLLVAGVPRNPPSAPNGRQQPTRPPPVPLSPVAGELSRTRRQGRSTGAALDEDAHDGSTLVLQRQPRANFKGSISHSVDRRCPMPWSD